MQEIVNFGLTLPSVSGSINPFSRGLVTAVGDKDIPNPPSNKTHFPVLHARVSSYSWAGGTTLSF